MTAPFTKEMKSEYTLLIPDMLPIHFSLIAEIFNNNGYHAEVLSNHGPNVIRQGLRHTHNDMCYPAQLVIGQFLDALTEGGYDPHKTALIITQTGGGCRASNYIYLLRKALKRANMAYVPVISLNFKGMDENPGFRLTFKMIAQAYAASVYGDMIMLVSNQVRPYEINKGDTDRLIRKWTKDLGRRFKVNRNYWGRNMEKNLNRISDDFASIPVKRTKKIKVGIVGEIYMKYASLGNNNLREFLEENGCEVMIPSLMNFIYYGFDNAQLDRKYYGHLFWQTVGTQLAMHYLFKGEKRMLNAIKRHPEFVAPSPYRKSKQLNNVIDFGVKMGEGWLLTAEMLELNELGYSNIICVQPFGCLPNHICAKGMIHTVREQVPDANIVPIDFDPSESHVNQENRIKLMLAIAKDNLK